LPEISWFIDETKVSLLHDNNYLENAYSSISVGSYRIKTSETVSFLNISNSRVEDSGVYKCEASNLAGSAYHSSRLNIYGGIFIRKMKPVTIVAGKTTLISCPFGGYPVDKITWQKDSLDVNLLQNGNSHRFKVLSNGSLQIDGVKRDTDSGRYTCLISNRRGEIASELINVNVMRKKISHIFVIKVAKNSLMLPVCANLNIQIRQSFLHLDLMKV